MAATNITSLPKRSTLTTTLPGTNSSVLIPVVRSAVEIDTSIGSTYGNNFKRIPGAYAEQVTNIMGPEPPDTTFIIPVTKDTGEPGGVFDHKLYEIRDDSELSGIGPITVGGLTIRPFSKIRIKAVYNFLTTPKEITIYIGYVIDYEYIVQGDETTVYRITCQDARHLMGKAPVQGVLHYNDVRSLVTKQFIVTYIRDAEIIFNEKNLPNRLHDANSSDSTGSSKGTNITTPVFCLTDLNRFESDGAASNTGLYVHDGFIEKDNDDVVKTTIATRHARKFLPGHCINYMANLFDSYFIDPAGGNTLYSEPTSLAADRLPPILFNAGNPRNAEIVFTRLARKNDEDMGTDFFEPRSIIGATDPGIGQTQAVSAIGEFNPTGQPVNHAIDDVIRLVGNYMMVFTYTDRNAVMHIVRTVQARQSKLAADLPVGLVGGDKQFDLSAPTTKDSSFIPDINVMNLKMSGRAYHNRFHIKGGPRWIQITLATVASDGVVIDQLGQQHQQPNVPPGEWLPRILTNSSGGRIAGLTPGWSITEEKEWLFYSTAKLSFSLFPDVYRTWVVPDDLNWVEVWGLSGTDGYKFYFERDRSWLNHLLTSFYDLTVGVYRSRRVKFKTQIWRAMRGIRADSDGSTVYGDGETENDALLGLRDWFLIQSDFEIIADGRDIGFRLGEQARLNTLFPAEFSEDESGSEKRTPMSWNGVANLAIVKDLGDSLGFGKKKFLEYSEPQQAAIVKAYSPGGSQRAWEMMITIAVNADEELWDYLQIPDGSTINIPRNGPPMEMYRNGFSQYSQERASHSLVDIAFTAHRKDGNKTTLRAEPPTNISGLGDDPNEPRIYKDDKDELNARVKIMANRYGMIDIEAPVALPYINLAVQVGTPIRELFVEKDKNIPINAIVAAVQYDFQLQRTTIRLATIR